MNLPRYPKYKPSGVEWLGEVPDHWGVVPLKQLVEFQNGADHKSVEVEDGHPVYGSGGIFAYASEHLYDGESVLLGRKGTIDRPLYVNGKFWTVDTMYWTRILPGVSGRFCYYAATTIPFAYYSTSTALPSMTQGVLGAHWVARPPCEEQTAISAFLDHETAKIDVLVAEQERLIALLKEKRQAALSHAVTKGINPDALMKPSGIEWLGDVPAHWEVGPLKRFWSVTDCKHLTAEFVEKGFPLASIREVQFWFVVLEHAKRTTEYFYDQLIEGGREPQPGDLIFSRNATVGEVAQVPDSNERFAMGQDVCLLRRLDEAAAPDYMQFVLRSPVVGGQLDTLTIGSTFKRINVEEIRSLFVPCPPAHEQKTIIESLLPAVAAFDALVDECGRAVDVLRERRSSLISAAVTGQIDVRRAA